MTGPRLVAASESAPAGADPSHDRAAGAVSEASQWAVGVKVYVSGPMTGIPEFNYPAFATAETDLLNIGFDVVSPHRNGLPATAPWESHIRADVVAMLGCDAVVTLAGWERSRGARLETNLARELGMRVLGWPFTVREVDAARFLCGVGS